MNKELRVIIIRLFIFFVSIYLLSTSPTNIVDTDASQARFLVTRSIVEEFDLSIPSGLGVRGADGRDYSWYGLGQSVLGIPFYIFGQYIGNTENAVSIMPQVFGAATAVLVFLFS